MIVRSLSCLFLIFGLCVTVLSQIEVKPSETTFSRVNSKLPEYKRTFKVRYPVVVGIKSDAINKRISDHLDFWRISGTSLSESLNNYTWLDRFDYSVNYLAHDLLDITLIVEGSGAYPDTTMRTVVIDLKTGKKLELADTFQNFRVLLVEIEKKRAKEIRLARIEATEEDAENGRGFDSLIANKELSASKLSEFTVSDKGVKFLEDFGFPKAVRALEPNGEYFFTWDEIARFIAPTSPLLRIKTR